MKKYALFTLAGIVTVPEICVHEVESFMFSVCGHDFVPSCAMTSNPIRQVASIFSFRRACADTVNVPPPKAFTLSVINCIGPAALSLRLVTVKKLPSGLVSMPLYRVLFTVALLPGAGATYSVLSGIRLAAPTLSAVIPVVAEREQLTETEEISLAFCKKARQNCPRRRCHR